MRKPSPNPNPSLAASSEPGSSSGLQRGKKQQATTAMPCCSKVGMKRGPWTPEEDEMLSKYVAKEGVGRWRTLPKRAGLLRCGKSCRLRWMNYLRPSIKHGRIAPDEEDLILRLHRLLGNRWSLIAGRIPGRTDNEIKNYWNTHLSKKLISQGIDPKTHKPLNSNINPNPSPVQIPAQLPNPNPNRVPSVIQEMDGSENGISNHNGYYHGSHSMTLHASDNSAEDGLGIDCCNDDDFSSFLDSLINDDLFMQQENLHLKNQQQDGNEI